MFEAVSPGVVVRLQDLHPGSPLLQPNQSLRVVGSLQQFDVVSGIAVLEDGDSSLRIDMQHLRNISLRVGSLFEFIGELEILQQIWNKNFFTSLDYVTFTWSLSADGVELESGTLELPKIEPSKKHSINLAHSCSTMCEELM